MGREDLSKVMLKTAALIIIFNSIYIYKVYIIFVRDQASRTPLSAVTFYRYALTL